MNQGTSWSKLSEENCQRIIRTIPALATEVRNSTDGACSDLKITSLLGDIVTTGIVGLDNKVLNQKRAVWLTADKARNIYLANKAKIEAEKVSVLTKNAAKQVIALRKKTLLAVSAQVVDGNVVGLTGGTIGSVRCNNDCGSVRLGTAEGLIASGDKWKGCTKCPNWFCGKVRCLARFQKHHVICLSQNVI